MKISVCWMCTSNCVFFFHQVNLMQYMKLSTSRDFRINAATLDAVLQEQQEADSQQVSLFVFAGVFSLRPQTSCLTTTSVLRHRTLRAQNRLRSPGRRRGRCEDSPSLPIHLYPPCCTAAQEESSLSSILLSDLLNWGLLHGVLLQGALGDLQDLVNVQGFTCGEFASHY